jgi:hypothetical protein
VEKERKNPLNFVLELSLTGQQFGLADYGTKLFVFGDLIWKKTHWTIKLFFVIKPYSRNVGFLVSDLPLM